MFKHISLASSSKGNCHLISSDYGKTYIMLDGGITFKVLKKKLHNLKIGLHQIKGCFITHEHMDHFKGVKDLLPYMSVFGTEETLKTLGFEDVNLINIEKNKAFRTKNEISVIPFSVKHNAVDPVNYVFKNSIGEYGIYITDTSDVKLKLPNIRPTLIIIEANFDKDVLIEQMKQSSKVVKRDRGYESVMKRRQLEDGGGHLSWQDTLRILKTMQLGMCKQIILCHISSTNGYFYFADRVSEGLGWNIPTKQLNAYDIEITNIDTKIKIEF